MSTAVNTGTETLLDFLRQEAGLCGTKEGCNEGDCGACSVIVTGSDGAAQPMNACILFLPQLQGCSVRTVEGISGSDGSLHPVQDAMILKHGAQCGFCTPGFITTMAAAHANGETDFDTALAGNLCRCTGYAPIIRAAKMAAKQPVPRSSSSPPCRRSRPSRRTTARQRSRPSWRSPPSRASRACRACQSLSQSFRARGTA